MIITPSLKWLYQVSITVVRETTNVRIYGLFNVLESILEIELQLEKISNPDQSLSEEPVYSQGASEE